jgi:hypothetical protein
LTTKVNGKVVQEVTSATHERGVIALQHAQTFMAFKKIEIKELRPTANPL